MDRQVEQTSALEYAPLDGEVRQVSQAILEALLMVSEEPVPTAQLAAAIDQPEALTHQLLGEMAADLQGNRQGPERGFILRQVAGGWRFYVNPKYSQVVQEYLTTGMSGRLSQAALESLAVIAYRQPCTRAQVAAVRGVNVDSVIRTLLARGLIYEAGVSASGSSQYATTTAFLEQCGLDSLDDLPPLAPYLPDSNDLPEIISTLEETS